MFWDGSRFKRAVNVDGNFRMVQGRAAVYEAGGGVTDHSRSRSWVLCGRSAPPAIREWGLYIYPQADPAVPPGKKKQGREEGERNTTARRKAWVGWAMSEGSKSGVLRTKTVA